MFALRDNFKPEKINRDINCVQGASSVGAVLIALSFHKFGPGLMFRLGAICGSGFVVSLLCCKRFFSWYSRFPFF